MASDFARSGLRTLLRAGRQLVRTVAPDDLTQVSVPTLLVWGDHDTVVPLAVGQELAARLSNARLEVVQGAGHIPMWERPDEFHRLVVEFASGENARAVQSASSELSKMTSQAAQ